MLMSWTLPASRNAMCATSSPATLTAAADIVDTGDHYDLVVEMPGVEANGLSIDLENDSLVVRGERKGYATESKVLYNGRYAASTLERRFTIGRDVDRAGVKARLENGLLYVTLPRKAEERNRKIEVEVL